VSGSAETCWTEAEAARQGGRPGEAATGYRRTLALVPGFMAAHANLALMLEAEARLEAALAETRRARHIAPGHPQLPFNLGNLLAAARLPGGTAAYRSALALDPAMAPAWLALGTARLRDGAASAAEAAITRTLALAPAYAEAWNNLGTARQSQGRIEDALAAYDQALALEPSYADAARNRLGARLYLDDDEEKSGEAAHDFVRRFGARTPAPLSDADPSGRSCDPSGRSCDPDRLLAIGLLSSDLRDHPVGRNLAGLIEHRDPHEIRIAVYDTGAGSDPLQAWFRARTDLWRSVASLSDERIAGQIRADGIDILVSLAGRFDRNRPLVASWRAAPVQVAMYDGGASGMGHGMMDAGMAEESGDPPIAGWITDRWLHPEGTHAGGDRLLRLPACYNFIALEGAAGTYRPDPGRTVFGSFSNPAKLSPATLAAWKAILERLPEAHLVLKYRSFYGDPAIMRRIVEHFGNALEPRIRLIAALDGTRTHLERYAEIDIALDPFPFSGATTTFEALSMGVPVITLAARAAIGRTSTAILGPLGLDELIASSPADYVERATALAGDRQRLAALRAEIPRRLRASPLVDGKAQAQALTQMLRRLWRERCARRVP